jgi:hypothetical protein
MRGVPLGADVLGRLPGRDDIRLGYREADEVKRLPELLAIVVALVWSASFVADIMLGPDYEPSPYVHFAMMLVLGAYFGRQIVRGNGNK